MTKAQFQSIYGAEYAALVSSPMFAALLQTIDEASPTRRTTDEPLGNVVAAEGALLGQIRGWEALRKFLTETLTEEPPAPRREEDYTEPPI